MTLNSIQINDLSVKQECHEDIAMAAAAAHDIPVTAVHNLFRREPLRRFGERILRICQAVFVTLYRAGPKL